MKESRFVRTSVGNVRLHVLPTDRFKTFAISMYIGSPLNEQRITPTALTPFVLRRGTKSYPETKAFRERQDELYGAGFGFDVLKRGDYQIVHFRLDIVDDKFVSDGQSLLRQGLAFLGETVTKPALENNHFVNKYVEAEKATVRKKLEAVINDKIRYASERCMEEMCKNEPYRLSSLGRIEDLDAITPDSLYADYQKWLAESPIDLYIVGDTTLKEAEQFVRETFDFPARKDVTYLPLSPQSAVGEVKTVIEKLDVNQGKLNMGLRSSVTYADDRYASALMYNGILGAFPHSKLFVNVREKESLAYYAGSRLDGHKGILTIQSGIEVQNFEKATAIIKQQLAEMEAGVYSDRELNQTRAMIENHLREIRDSAFEMIGFDFNSMLSGKERTVDDLVEAIAKVTPQSIQEVAREVKLDTIYFLRDRKEE
ncbi:MAG: insulinase family protein [Gorillibacterium sp.]|nr:insulinase family protein [Gorillibacterium sp.]